MEKVVVELACVLEILVVKIVCTLTVHFAVFHSSFVPISVLELDLPVFNVLCRSLRYRLC